jgi:D-alanine transaminase
MEGIGLVDGRFVELDEYVVPIEDRGHQLGDGVYEAVLVYGGKPFLVVEHMERIFKSASMIKIDIPYTLEELVKFHLQLVEKTGLKEALIYSQFTRGVAPRKHAFPEGIKPRLSMTIRPWTKLDPYLKANGAKAILVPDERWLKCNIKSLNLLGNVLAKQTAHENGCFEAIMYRDGFITEGANSNVFVIKDNVIHTAPTDNKILAGITRSTILKFAREFNYVVKEEAVTPDFILNADEVFLTGTTTEVMPVVSINNQKIGDGKVGPITRKLHDAYMNKIQRECYV